MISYTLQEQFNRCLHQALENHDFIGLKPVAEFVYMALTPDSIYAHVTFIKERREYKFPRDGIPHQINKMVDIVSRDIMRWINERLYPEQTDPQELKCDHFYSFSIDCERTATCNSCGHTWKFDGFPCGNVNNGTFKVYGKEQTNPNTPADALLKAGEILGIFDPKEST